MNNQSGYTDSQQHGRFDNMNNHSDYANLLRSDVA
jgi:hypothetical protein